VLFTDGMLVIALKMKRLARIFRSIRNCGTGELDAENECAFGLGYGNFHDGFAASVEFAQQCFAVENLRKA
jgi:hypothetical protein